MWQCLCLCPRNNACIPIPSRADASELIASHWRRRQPESWDLSSQSCQCPFTTTDDDEKLFPGYPMGSSHFSLVVSSRSLLDHELCTTSSDLNDAGSRSSHLYLIICSVWCTAHYGGCNESHGLSPQSSHFVRAGNAMVRRGQGFNEGASLFFADQVTQLIGILRTNIKGRGIIRQTLRKERDGSSLRGWAQVRRYP